MGAPPSQAVLMDRGADFKTAATVLTFQHRSSLSLTRRIMHRLFVHSTLHLHAGGHVDMITIASELAPVIAVFYTRATVPK
jgi:hypothetical protein